MAYSKLMRLRAAFSKAGRFNGKVCALIISMPYVDLKPTRLLQLIYFSGGLRKHMILKLPCELKSYFALVEFIVCSICEGKRPH